MANKIPPEAFDFYVSLGHQRTYQQVADKYGVTRRGVQKVADRDNWGERLDAIEREVQERAEKALVESVAEVRARHLKMLKGISGRAVKAIAEHPLETGMEGIRAAEIAIKLERIIVGEPSERTEHTIAETTRQEMDRFLSRADEMDDEADW
jgi:hypothetical protein